MGMQERVKEAETIYESRMPSIKTPIQNPISLWVFSGLWSLYGYTLISANNTAEPTTEDTQVLCAAGNTRRRYRGIESTVNLRDRPQATIYMHPNTEKPIGFTCIASTRVIPKHVTYITAVSEHHERTSCRALTLYTL